MMGSSQKDRYYRVYLPSTISPGSWIGRGSDAAGKTVIATNNVSKEILKTGRIQQAYSAVKNFSPRALLGRFSNTAEKTVEAAEKSVKAAEKTTSFIEKVAPNCNKILGTAATVARVYEVGQNAAKDYKEGTMRNTVTATSCIGASMGGGFAGAKAGALLGTLILPGIGTAAGTIIGSIGGQIVAAKVAKKIVDDGADAMEFNIKKLLCELCMEEYLCRIYTGQSQEICPACESLPVEWLDCRICHRRFRGRRGIVGNNCRDPDCKAAGKIGEILKPVNKIIGYAVICHDAYKIGASAIQDFREGTIRNTPTTILSISGCRTGASAGAKIGAAIGSSVLPGIGTIAGTFLGGYAGASGGTLGGEKIAKWVLKSKL